MKDVKPHEDFTVLVQGPFDPTSFKNVRNYSKYGKVVVSCWSGISGEEESTIRSEKCELVIKDLPDITKTIGLYQNSTFYYALTSIFNGVEKIDTKYVIKTRSDEYYENLEPFIEELMNDDNKIVCGNIFARKDIPFHFGDHIFACKTEDLFGGVKNLLDHYTNIKSPLNTWMDQKTNPAETILSRSILENKKIDTTINQNQVSIENITVIDINRTKNFIAKWNHNNLQYINSFQNPYGVRDQNDYK